MSFFYIVSMKKINVEDSIGMVLCHDMTQIIPGQTKDARFRKGHIITSEDIPVLLSMGKKHIFVYEMNENMMHENDAAIVLSNMCISENMVVTDIKEGKLELKSKIKGYLHVDKERLEMANMHDDITIATIKDGNVEENQKIAGMRVIPLVIEKAKLKDVQTAIGTDPLLKIYPYRIKNFGLVVTGSEVYNGIIEDKFSKVIEEKMLKFDVKLVKKIICDDNKEMIRDAIVELKKMGCELICCTGGMSVDPDDMTPVAIKESGANIVTYGTPFLPGAMFLLGYFDDETPIMGLPGCVMYAKNTVFDVFLPKVLACIKLAKNDFARLGYGGLCKQCEICHFPNCTFGN